MRHVRREGAHGPLELVRLRLADGHAEVLDLELDFWPQVHGLSPDGQRLYVTADWRGVTPAFAVDLTGGQVERLSSKASGGTFHALEVLPEGDVLLGLRSSMTEPPAPHLLEAREGAHPERVADLSGLDLEADRVAITHHEAGSSDGQPCPYWIVAPAPGERRSPGPALMWIHGGPIGAWGDVWHWRWNPLVGAARGYTMVLPNPRGSTGFGQDWVEGIWGNVWGAQCYEDLMAVADAIEAREEVDSGRVAAMGGSFGGYMANWIGGQTDRFACLVTHAGLTNLSSFHDVTDLPPWWRHMFEANPYTDRAEFDRYSPLRFVERWRSPTLIVHGQRDYRVPVGEALGLFAALQHHGVDSQLLIFPDENHWILKPRNITAWYGRIFEFLDAHAGADGPDGDDEQ